MSDLTAASTVFLGTQVNLACFEVRGRLFAIDVYQVREIVRWQEVTPLPKAPDLIEGVVDLRGGVVPVLDLGRVLGGDLIEITVNSRIVVLEVDGLVFALQVEAAVDVLSLEPSELEDPPELAAQAGYEAVRAVVRRSGAPPVMVLSLEHVLESVYRPSLASGELR